MHAEVQEEFDVVEDIPDQSYDSFLVGSKSANWFFGAATGRARMRSPRGHNRSSHHLRIRQKTAALDVAWNLRVCHARFAERFQSGDRRARRDDWRGKIGRNF